MQVIGGQLAEGLFFEDYDVDFASDVFFGAAILAPLPIGVTLPSKKPVMPLTVRLVCSVNFFLADTRTFMLNINA
jgi:hypothetical protein